MQIEPEYTAWFARDDGSEHLSAVLKKKKKDAGYGGWSFKGITRFRELVKLVTEDRNKVEQKEMEKRFLEYMISKAGDNVVTKKKTGTVSQEAEMMKLESVWKDLVGEDTETDNDDDGDQSEGGIGNDGGNDSDNNSDDEDMVVGV